MTHYLLDTNIISETVRPLPSAALLDWLGRQADTDLFIAALTVAEIRRGILDLPAGAKRSALDAWFDGPEGPAALFAGRILSFDLRGASAWAQLMADGKAIGRPRSAFDMIIAATAITNGCVVVSANERDFDCVPTINPLRA
ncbi:type II toxin-antitoxin system VapC family toxin [Zavarzinia sp.]|uniref:type II toxin-antitoxin system VapC family toxin n=1 Tax=Zavarzinia sp. TaxID=2027920 RepID=UPI0035693BBC